MALINCPECGKEISDQAVSCPNCGMPLVKTQQILPKNRGNKKVVAIIAIIVGILAIIGVSVAILAPKSNPKKIYRGITLGMSREALIDELSSSFTEDSLSRYSHENSFSIMQNSWESNVYDKYFYNLNGVREVSFYFDDNSNLSQFIISFREGTPADNNLEAFGIEKKINEQSTVYETFKSYQKDHVRIWAKYSNPYSEIESIEYKLID